MTSPQRAAGLLVGLVAACVPALIGASPAAAASWTLQDVQQQICVDPEFGHPATYVLAPVVGSWSTSITTGVRKLPPGSSSAGGSTLPPGSNDGSSVNGFVQLSLAPAPAGVYVSEVWASDGTETQAVPVRITFQDGC